MRRLSKLATGLAVLGAVLALDRWLGSGRAARPESGITARVLILGAVASSLVGGVLIIVAGLPWLLERNHYPLIPPQPVPFNHQVHVQVAGADCSFCHRTAAIGDSAGLPDVEQCMFCHLVVDGSSSEPSLSAAIQDVQMRWSEQRPIDWARLHHIPDHSRFPHSAHVAAGVPCAECHGEVESMVQVRQVRSLLMSDCVTCHQETAAPLQCVTCHH